MVFKTPVISFRNEEGSFRLYRDNNELKTPAQYVLAVPTQALAEAIAEEFRTQGSKMDLRKMPLTQMTLTAIDVAGPQRAALLDGLMRYGQTELVCQRALDPAGLVAEQNKIWQPYLDWCKNRFRADLRTGSGIVPFDQRPEALAALQSALEEFDAFTLTGVSEACKTLGSLVLALALVEGRASVKEAVEASELDSLWQTKTWGDDPVSQKRYNDIHRDLEVCATWFVLIKKNQGTESSAP